MVQVGSIFWINFSQETIRRSDQIGAEGIELFKKLHQDLLENGVYMGPSGYEVGFVSAAHTPADLKVIADKICNAFDLIFKYETT
jgi:Glutamate-1-semialdehyde aminotransferase